MSYYNPMLDYKRNELMAQQAMIQQQLAQLNQMQQVMPQQPVNPQVQSQSASQTQYVVKEINGFDEAKRVVPNFGEIHILIDSNGGKIYLKQMNPDTGKSDYLFYNIDNTEREEAKDPMAVINERLSNIEKSIGELRNESIPGNAAISGVYERPDGNNHTEPVPANATAEPAKVPNGGKNVERKDTKRAS